MYCPGVLVVGQMEGRLTAMGSLLWPLGVMFVGMLLVGPRETAAATILYASYQLGVLWMAGKNLRTGSGCGTRIRRSKGHPWTENGELRINLVGWTVRYITRRRCN